MTRWPYPKDLRKLIHAAIRAGFTQEFGRKHAKLRAPDGNYVTVCSSSSDSNYAKIAAREIHSVARKAGLVLEP